MRCSACSAPSWRDRVARGGRRLAGELERGQRRARVAAGARREEREHVVGHLGRRALAALQGPAQQRLDLLRAQLVQLVDLRAAQQRRVDLEVRVLGRRADERDEPLLDGGQQRVLLGLVEAVDLVEEEDRRLAARLAPVRGAVDDAAHLGAAGLHGAELLEGGVRRARDDPRERRLAGPGRAVEDHRVRPAVGDRAAQRRRLLGRAEQVRLADELVDRARAHAHGERGVGLGHRRRRAGRLVAHVEELVGHGRQYRVRVGGLSQASAARSMSPGPGRRRTLIAILGPWIIEARMRLIVRRLSRACRSPPCITGRAERYWSRASPTSGSSCGRIAI